MLLTFAISVSTGYGEATNEQIPKPPQIASISITDQVATEAAAALPIIEQVTNETVLIEPLLPIKPEVIIPTIDEKVKKGYLIIVNVETNRMTIYKDLKKVFIYKVATGKIINGKSLTPLGKFTILNKVVKPGWGGGGYAEPIRGGDPKNPLGNYWAGTSAGKNPGGSIGVHGNVDEDSIGTNASHGCIRMSNKEIPIFFKLAQIAMPVWIGDSKHLTSWGVVDFE